MKRRFIHIVFLLFAFSVSHAQNNSKYAFPNSPQNLPPVPDFSWTSTCIGDTTCFINQTIRGYTYTWTVSALVLFPHPHPDTVFQSNDTNLCYFFSAPGTYTVSLQAWDNHLATMTKVITIDSLTKAAFSFQACSNNFINNSLCASTFYWDFGDGANSTADHPVHQYADTGIYNVMLVAYKWPNISDTVRQQVNIRTESFAQTLFTYQVNDTVVQFHASYSAHAAVQYHWVFGQGIFATGQDTVHTYKDSTAKYSVLLNVINQCGPEYGGDSVQILKYIPAANFSQNSLVLGPNPVLTDDVLTGYCQTFGDENYRIVICDLMGRSVYEADYSFQAGVNVFRISTVGFAEGNYTLVARDGNSYLRSKFVVFNRPAK